MTPSANGAEPAVLFVERLVQKLQSVLRVCSLMLRLVEVALMDPVVRLVRGLKWVVVVVLAAPVVHSHTMIRD